ncbi:hypothetical protein F5Y19DRAFT_175416 [Xylariaceae sp. FL1651]|nr:hypothetical protein F5Y19DRAFT_175416 [Xylariaceae sp. FL1651]
MYVHLSFSKVPIFSALSPASVHLRTPSTVQYQYLSVSLETFLPTLFSLASSLFRPPTTLQACWLPTFHLPPFDVPHHRQQPGLGLYQHRNESLLSSVVVRVIGIRSGPAVLYCGIDILDLTSQCLCRHLWSLSSAKRTATQSLQLGTIASIPPPLCVCPALLPILLLFAAGRPPRRSLLSLTELSSFPQRNIGNPFISFSRFSIPLWVLVEFLSAA